MADENRIIRLIAVTISGLRIGILFILSTTSLIIFLLFERPIAVIVPRTVEAKVANNAIVRDTYTALMIEPSEISLEYHLRDTPLMLVRLFDELKENTIITTIGR
jgi:hypothetical protein